MIFLAVLCIGKYIELFIVFWREVSKLSRNWCQSTFSEDIAHANQSSKDGCCFEAISTVKFDTILNRSSMPFSLIFSKTWCLCIVALYLTQRVTSQINQSAIYIYKWRKAEGILDKKNPIRLGKKPASSRKNRTYVNYVKNFVLSLHVCSK